MSNYTETSNGRVLALLQNAGDRTPFLALGRGIKRTAASSGFASGPVSGRDDEELSLLIRPVSVGPVVTMETPLPGTQVKGALAESAGIAVADPQVSIAKKRLSLLSASMSIGSDFRLLYKSRDDVLDEEAAEAGYYSAVDYAAKRAIVDVSDGPTGPGLFAIELVATSATPYAAELFIQDFNTA